MFGAIDKSIPLRGATVATVAIVLLSTVMAVNMPANAQRALDQAAPEAATGRSELPTAAARHSRSMVVAAHPLAVEAGVEILEAGGSAIDAAIAVQAVLGLVEPQSSGLGGGAFLFVLDRRQQQSIRTYDGRETAPGAATPDRFMRAGKPMPFGAAVLSGLSIGVPGVVRALDLAHRTHGRLDWARLLAPAIRLADEGFMVSPRLAALLADARADRFDPVARRYFFAADGRPPAAGSRLRNPDYARTLRAIAGGGADAFYTGAIADGIVDAARRAPGFAGDVSHADLAGYRALERKPLCFDYRAHKVCGMGPPSSGAVTVGQTLRLVESFDLGTSPGAALAPSAVHWIAEAEKLAYADRDHYVADPDFVAVPDGLLDDGYMAERRKLMAPGRAMAKATPGKPPGKLGLRDVRGTDETVELAGTSHISIVDRDGVAVAMTTTIEGGFGSHVMTGGFLLNNQLTDFSFRPIDAAGRPIANAVAPGKRPRSSMAPTIVLAPDGSLRFVLGSPGGSRIILYVVKTLVGLIDWQLDPDAAAGLMNFGSRGGALELEHDGGAFLSLRHIRAGADAATLAIWMRSRGHALTFVDMTSGTHIVAVEGGKLIGGVDPRREGLARGQ